VAGPWKFKSLRYSGHAIKQMFARSISTEEVITVLHAGEIATEYPDDTPYPSRLMSGRAGMRQIHVVVGYNREEMEGIVITVYEPSVQLWDTDFKTRKPR